MLDCPAMPPGVAKLVAALGSPSFMDEIAALGSSLLPHDHIGCHLFRFDGNGRPSFEQPLFVRSYDGSDAVAISGRAYLSRWWQDDPDLPMLAETSTKRSSWLSVLPTREVRSEGYVNYCARPSNVQERVAITVRVGERFASLRFYRGFGRPAVGPTELEALNEYSELLGVLCLKQAEMRASQADTDSYLAELAVRARAAGHRLSTREQEVLRGILVGKAMPEIAAELGIALTSAITFRARAYEKLGVCTRIELFRCCLGSKRAL